MNPYSKLAKILSDVMLSFLAITIVLTTSNSARAQSVFYASIADIGTIDFATEETNVIASYSDMVGVSRFEDADIAKTTTGDTLVVLGVSDSRAYRISLSAQTFAVLDTFSFATTTTNLFWSTSVSLSADASMQLIGTPTYLSITDHSGAVLFENTFGMASRHYALSPDGEFVYYIKGIGVLDYELNKLDWRSSHVTSLLEFEYNTVHSFRRPPGTESYIVSGESGFCIAEVGISSPYAVQPLLPCTVNHADHARGRYVTSIDTQSDLIWRGEGRYSTNYLVLQNGAISTITSEIEALAPLAAIPLQLPSGTNDTRINDHLTVYPNPTAGQEFINVATKGAMLSDLVLYDAQGQLIRTVCAPCTNQATWQVSLDRLPRGAYILVGHDKLGNSSYATLVR